ncbi:hypothetical protein BJY52DRAFT_1222504 [Lactarius psammicola]|nr:hypothetical protein BJY52DRAFT_1222504 [Lactarius psammicola]
MFCFLELLSGTSLFSSAAAQRNIWQITVGSAEGESVFFPEYVVASPGDTVKFIFNPKNHSVTQSTFKAPCTSRPGGFDSGFNPVAIGTTFDRPTFNFTVDSADPIWIYCKQGENSPFSHCGKGMVFAVNPGDNDTCDSFTAFNEAAKRAQGPPLSVVYSEVAAPTPV